MPKWWAKFLFCSAAVEMVAWTILVPYLVSQQWSMWLGIGLLTWWFVGYWPMVILNTISYLKMRKVVARLNLLLDQMDQQASDEVPEGWAADGPVYGPFSSN